MHDFCACNHKSICSRPEPRCHLQPQMAAARQPSTECAGSALMERRLQHCSGQQPTALPTRRYMHAQHCSMHDEKVMHATESGRAWHPLTLSAELLTRTALASSVTCSERKQLQ